jgi:hypothetical protein
MFLNYFDELLLKINYFNIFSSKKTLKNNLYYNLKYLQI